MHSANEYKRFQPFLMRGVEGKCLVRGFRAVGSDEPLNWCGTWQVGRPGDIMNQI